MSCKKQCSDASNPNCENYDPCLFYQKPWAQIEGYEYRNDLYVRSDSFMIGGTACLYSVNGDNFTNTWYDFANNKLKSGIRYYMHVDTNMYKGVSLYSFVNRVEECKQAKLLDTAFRRFSVFSRHVINSSTFEPMINPVVNWYGEYEGVGKGSIEGKLTIKIQPHTEVDVDRHIHGALLTFVTDTCLGSYWIDNNYGVKWFSSYDFWYKSSYCPSRVWFQEIYGTFDDEHIKIIGLNTKDNYEFEFTGTKK